MATVRIKGFGAPLKLTKRVHASVFDNEIPGTVPRDGHRRPLIIQPDGSLAPYARVSTVSGTATDGHGLAKWKIRHTALSIGRHPDLAGMIAALEYGDPELDAAIDAAQERSVEMVAKRHYGTALHSFTAMADDDYRREFIPERMVLEIASYTRELDRVGLRPVESEIFLVNDELEVAGTTDDLYFDTNCGFFVIGDKKSGKNPSKFAVSAQLGMYVGGERYDPETGDRSPIHESMGDDVAMVHIPAERGVTKILRLPVKKALQDAKLCVMMYRRRAEKAQVQEW